MSRSRIVKPEFFRHSELYQAEVEAGLPLRLAFEGLWTVADREGRFVWKPTELKLDVLPYDPVDFGAVLDALEKHGFIVSYVVEGKRYGHIPSFLEHQTFHPHEAKSKLPAPTLATNGEQCQPVSISVSTSISTSVSSEAKASGEADRKEEPRSDLATVMGAIRKFGYLGGKPPKKGDDARDATVAKRLLEMHSVDDVVRAVEGTRMLVDRGDLAPALTPRSPFTLRLVHAGWGATYIFRMALDAYYAQAPPEPTKRERSAPTEVGSDVDRVLKQMTG